MNENLDLTEILKDAPKGTKLWSSICGECELVKIDGENTDPIICRTKTDGGGISHESFSAEGKFYCDYKNGECVLFPSKENRDWSTFKVPNQHKHFEPFQKVLCAVPSESGYEVWNVGIYSHYDESNRTHFLISGFTKKDDDDVIPYEGNEDKLGKKVK